MKKVFSANSQLAHVWAQQTQNEGRGNNTFFRGTKLYSYGTHYLSAEIHTYKGKKFALVNSKSYSVTTSNHLSDACNALFGLIPYFRCPDPTNPKAAIKYFDQCARDNLNSMLKTSKVTKQNDFEHDFSYCVKDSFIKANALRSIFGMKLISPNKYIVEKVKKHYTARLKRYHELNTPEALVKKEIKRLKQVAIKEEKTRNDLVDSINKFRSGEHTDWSLHSLSHELIRIKNDVVQTSRGAEVPLSQAKLLYKALMSNRDVKGAKVGEFTVISATPFNGDKAIKIGCHTILLSEATNVLGNLSLLKG